MILSFDFNYFAKDSCNVILAPSPLCFTLPMDTTSVSHLHFWKKHRSIITMNDLKSHKILSWPWKFKHFNLYRLLFSINTKYWLNKSFTITSMKYYCIIQVSSKKLIFLCINIVTESCVFQISRETMPLSRFFSFLILIFEKMYSPCPLRSDPRLFIPLFSY